MIATRRNSHVIHHTRAHYSPQEKRRPRRSRGSPRAADAAPRRKSSVAVNNEDARVSTHVNSRSREEKGDSGREARRSGRQLERSERGAEEEPPRRSSTARDASLRVEELVDLHVPATVRGSGGTVDGGGMSEKERERIAKQQAVLFQKKEETVTQRQRIAWKRLISSQDKMKRKVYIEAKSAWMTNMLNTSMNNYKNQGCALVFFTQLLARWKCIRVSHCISLWRIRTEVFESESSLDIQWRHEILRRDGQFTGLLTSTGLAMKRHREENRLTLVHSGLRSMTHTVARWGTAIHAVRAVQTWRVNAVCGLNSAASEMRCRLSQRRVFQAEAFIRVRLVLLSYLHSHQWTCVVRWRHAADKEVVRLQLEAAADQRTEAADGALAKAMLRSHTDRHNLEHQHASELEALEVKLDEVIQKSQAEIWEAESAANETIATMQSTMDESQVRVQSRLEAATLEWQERLSRVEATHQEDLRAKDGSIGAAKAEREEVVARYEERLEEMRDDATEASCLSQGDIDRYEATLVEERREYSEAVRDITSQYERRIKSLEESLRDQADESIRVLKLAHADAMNRKNTEHEEEVARIKTEAAHLKVEFEQWMDEFEQTQ